VYNGLKIPLYRRLFAFMIQRCQKSIGV